MTVTTAGLISALILVTAVLAHGVHDTIGHHRDQVAADLSAVAGAYAAYYGTDPCTAAHTTARHNDATLTTCTVTESDVTVTIGDITATAGPL